MLLRRPAACLLSAAVLLVTLACGSQPQPSASAPSPTGSPSLEPSPTDWGPLAAYRYSGVVMDALLTAQILITDSCSFASRRDGNQTLIAWPDSLTTWDAVEEEIVVTAADETTRLRNGTSVAMGGGFVPAEMLDGSWVSAPSPECITESVWVAGGEFQQP